ncbi:hypothetical protein EKO04_002647 [Ascochyta lentis]|uniref:Calcineurin-like phosphoesterase domain-containing protein n=1 Tax=Ascochyta lentis TaxID=205686 RepID=A0A8H7JCG2_9PLEO|nr:hypothetical protein EKO04_002647 [Ascochyta lentis]
MSITTSISCLILSDTHNEWPYSADHLAPKADILIHCGDLTQYGGLPSFKRAIDNINSMDAELKLVIAGNHDVDPDPAWLQKFAEDDNDVEIGAKCLSLMKSQQHHGTHYLDEGVHSFALKDGRSFKVYATPYTPEFGEFAFLYGEDEDKFNEGVNVVLEGVDIVMSHGPPTFPMFPNYKLDINRQGKHCGCGKLAKAVQRAKPKLCCFGHIHEGRGVAKIYWAAESLVQVAADGNAIEVSKSGIENVDETLLVNAAILGNSKGWMVNITL